MSANTDLKITRSQLLSPEVDRALARQRALLGRAAPPPVKVGLLRRVLLSSMFYLPLAGLAGALAAWLLLEPYIQDSPRAAGQVVLVNNDPFDAKGAVSMTIGETEVIVFPGKVSVFPGARGEPPFQDLDQIRVGTIVEAVGLPREGSGKRFVASALRPASEEDAAAVEARASRESPIAIVAFFPLTATLIGVALLVAEVLSRRNYGRLVDRALAGGALAALFSFLCLIPGGLVFRLGEALVEGDPGSKAIRILFVTCRSVAWAFGGAGLGLGMNLTRSTRAELRNSAVGGALGGALGGLFFDPIDWIAKGSVFQQAGASRVVGVMAIGLAIGVFVALLERLTREAWVRVRTGPLAGKSFILYRTPTTVGSAPSSDIYLFKDAAIDAHHASIHRVGQAYEIEDQGSREGTLVGDQKVRRRRLLSGDQIVVGSTVLEFEERALRPQALATAGRGA
jgi:Inner membrane component of T3SS, cytoplasmic domain